MKITSVNPGNGKTIRAWVDCWNDLPAMEEFPHLYSFSNNQDISLYNLKHLADVDFYSHFHLPLSMIADQERHDLQLYINNIETGDNNKDQWVLPWNGNLAERHMRF